LKSRLHLPLVGLRRLGNLSQPAIEIPPTLASRPPARTGKLEFQPVEAGFVCVDAVSTALSMSVDICLCQRS
jgi:hypothetical protein